VDGWSNAWIGERVLWSVGKDFGRESQTGVNVKNSESIAGSGFPKGCHRETTLHKTNSGKSFCKNISGFPNWMSAAGMTRFNMSFDLCAAFSTASRTSGRVWYSCLLASMNKRRLLIPLEFLAGSRFATSHSARENPLKKSGRVYVCFLQGLQGRGFQCRARWYSARP
jgi:hypothetical protein